MKKIRTAYQDTLFPHIIFIAAIIIVSFIFGMKAFAYQDGDQYKIAYLLNEIGASDLKFIRNGNEYTGEEAKAHLKIKLEYAGTRIHTAEDFITEIASKSSVTSLPYYIQYKNGERVEAAQWLRYKLEMMQRRDNDIKSQ